MTRIRKILKWPGSALLLLLAAGAIYQQVGLALDARLAPAASDRVETDGRAAHLVRIASAPTARGRFVDVAGHRVWVVASGSTGPTVVFVSGLGDDHTVWDQVQPAIAAFASTLSYDRPGLGKSDPSDAPRDVATLARELHDLLVRGAVARPYVLVGHSLGGPIARIFAGLYPDEVAGMVMVDPEDHRLLDSLQARLPAKEWADRQVAMANAMPHMPPAWRTELLASESSGSQVEHAGPLPDVPLVLLTGTKKNPEFPGNPLEQDLKLAIQLQDLEGIPDARHVLVPESRHYIQNDAPQAVVDAIRQVLGKAISAH